MHPRRARGNGKVGWSNAGGTMALNAAFEAAVLSTLILAGKGLADIPAGLSNPAADHVGTNAQIPGYMSAGYALVPHLLDCLELVHAAELLPLHISPR